MSTTACDVLTRAATAQLRTERDTLRQILLAVEKAITFATPEEADASGLGLPDDVAWAVYWANRGELAKALASLGQAAQAQ